MKFGVICSSGGSAFFSAFGALREAGMLQASQVMIVTDRDCPALARARSLGIASELLSWNGRDEFSRAAYERLYSFDASAVLLLFSRLVGPDLYAGIPTVNFHPSLLPEFPGFGALQAAVEAGAKTIGATSHLVDGSVDDGLIIDQVCTPRDAGWCFDDIEHVSYLQKTCLILLVVEQMLGGGLDLSGTKPAEPRITPQAGRSGPDRIRNPALRAAFFKLQTRDQARLDNE